MSAILSISPVDGRYQKQTSGLAPFFSEFGLIKYRVLVEIEYFIALCQLPLPGLESLQNNFSLFNSLHLIVQNFSEQDALRIKDIEKTTNHDVKAVEYFLKEKFDQHDLSAYKEFIHFGLTSQDINNTAIPLSIKQALHNEILPMLDSLVSSLQGLATQWKDISLLARTHGQPASPTKLGKEIQVFVERLEKQILSLKQTPMAAKFGGATGNFNAHHVAFPQFNWIQFGNQFVNDILGLERSQYTTQIEHYDQLAALCDAAKRINNILIDFCRDVWTYISMEYFKQRIKEGEIGSSAMPHKVNPIDFENAEGNLGVANALLEHFAAKLPISRLQRDLTDSTVLRNIGVPFAHQVIALKSIDKGLSKLLLNKAAIEADLESNWAVVAEAIQTILRSTGYANPYEALKDLTRTNEQINQQAIHNFIDRLDVDTELKLRLKTITPHNYTGVY